MRVDKFLKVSRLIKRRTVANEACDAGRILVNGKVVKASYDVKEGDVIGTVTLSYKDQALCTVDLIATENIDRSELLTALDGIKNVVSSKWFIISVGVIAFLIMIYIIVVLVYKRKKRSQRPVKKYRKF